MFLCAFAALASFTDNFVTNVSSGVGLWYKMVFARWRLFNGVVVGVVVGVAVDVTAVAGPFDGTLELFGNDAFLVRTFSFGVVSPDGCVGVGAID